MLRVLAFLGVILLPNSALAANIMVEATSDDSTGQSIVYNLRNEIARSSIHKVVYARGEAGFIIKIVTLKQNDGRTSVYAANLVMPPVDGKGFDYFLNGIVGFCGSSVTRDCGANILAKFDGDIAQVVTAFNSVLKK